MVYVNDIDFYEHHGMELLCLYHFIPKNYRCCGKEDFYEHYGMELLCPKRPSPSCNFFIAKYQLLKEKERVILKQNKKQQ